MSLVFACIAPHGGLAIAELCRPEDRDVAIVTRKGMEELGRRFERAKPDVTVVLTPHNIHIDGAMAVVTAGSLYGELKEGGAGRGAFDPNAGSGASHCGRRPTVGWHRPASRRCAATASPPPASITVPTTPPLR